MITVLTPTVRPDGLKLVEKSLKRQTNTDWEWVIVSPFQPTTSVPHTWVEEVPKNEGDYWSIYKSLNKALKVCKGALIVSWQDYTYAKPDTLERFANHFKAEPKALVTGVGDKYADDTFTVVTWKDPRKQPHNPQRYYECYPQDIEWNLCSVPKEAILAVGGFDERLDKYSSLCGLDVVMRLEFQGGWSFKINQDIEHYSLEHGRLPEWSENEPFANGVWKRFQAEYLENPRLNYTQ